MRFFCGVFLVRRVVASRRFVGGTQTLFSLSLRHFVLSLFFGVSPRATLVSFTVALAPSFF